MIQAASRFGNSTTLLNSIPKTRSTVFGIAAYRTEAFFRTRPLQQHRMGVSWSSSSRKKEIEPILWTSIDSLPITKIYDAFQVSVGLSEEAVKKLENGGRWRIDFEIDVANMQKRLSLCEEVARVSPVQRLAIKGDNFRRIIEANNISNDELCNISAMHFELEAGVQQIGQFCLLSDVFREGMHECPTNELSRKVYGTTKQKVPQRLT